MSTAWETYHRRHRALRGVVAELDASGVEDVPWSEDLAGVFADRDDLLVALHDLWSRRLEGRVEMALDVGVDLPAECVETAWYEVAAELPGVRRVLDAHAHDQVLRRHEQHEHRLLAIAAGMADPGAPLAPAAAAGAQLVADIRARHVAPAVPRPRLRERVAAAFRFRPSPADLMAAPAAVR